MPLSTKYPGGVLDDLPEGAPLDQDERLLDNVPAQFARLRTDGDRCALGDAGLIPGEKYTYQNSPTNSPKSHFQGILRLGTSGVIVLSGGDRIDRRAQLFFGHLTGADTRAPVGSNLLNRKPPASDRLTGIAMLDDTLWHAGGMAQLGDVLAVPLENADSSSSCVTFYSVADPDDPLRLSIDIPRKMVAGAVALTRIETGHVLCAVWSDSDKKRAPGLDFYLSRGPSIRDGFLRKPAAQWDFAHLVPRAPKLRKYQSIAFLRQPDGRLYLVGTGNTDATAPVGGLGDDFADLLEVELLHAPGAGGRPVVDKPLITKVADKTFDGRDDYGNLAGAGGVHVTASGRLTLLTAYHWRFGKKIRIKEFGPEYSLQEPPVPDPEDAWIHLYEHDHFHGRRLTLYGTERASLPDYKALDVQGGSFGDKVSSARFQLPLGVTYRLFRKQRFETGKRGTGYLDLEGTGTVVEIRDFGQSKFNDAVRSSRYLLRS